MWTIPDDATLVVGDRGGWRPANGCSAHTQADPVFVRRRTEALSQSALSFFEVQRVDRWPAAAPTQNRPNRYAWSLKASCALIPAVEHSTVDEHGLQNFSGEFVTTQFIESLNGMLGLSILDEDD